jgi:hypothetical protein
MYFKYYHTHHPLSCSACSARTRHNDLPFPRTALADHDELDARGWPAADGDWPVECYQRIMAHTRDR